MIEIQISNGDWAEAETESAALLAARTMMDEAADAGACLSLLRASFYVNGQLVRGDVRRSELWC